MKPLLLLIPALLLIACGGGAPPPPPAGEGAGASGAPAGAAPGGGISTVAGRITFAGPRPPVEAIAITKDLEVCGAHPVVNEELVVGADGGLQNAVVSIVGPPAAATPAGAGAAIVPELHQKGCVFRPHVSVVPAGAPVAVFNDDGVLHNIHTYSALNKPFNRAQPRHLKRIEVRFEKAETIRVACDAHPWMSAWVVVTDQAHVAVSDAAGVFRLDGVPAGTYTARVWHEKLGEKMQAIEVQAGAETALNVEYR